LISSSRAATLAFIDQHPTTSQVMQHAHGRNFVVKCGGTGWCESNITKPKEKMWGKWHIISPLSEKVGGGVPRVPHLIASMSRRKANSRNHCYWKQITLLLKKLVNPWP